MRALGRVLLFAALMVPLGALPVWGDEFIRDAVQKCGHFEDATLFSPGLTNTPRDQTVITRGRIFGCNKAGGSGTFNGSLSLPDGTCAMLPNLRMSGQLSITWINGRTTNADVTWLVSPVTPAKATIRGQVVSGTLYVGLLLEVEVRMTQTFTGTGAPCSPTNPLRRIDVTNSRSLRIGTGFVTTTTTTRPPLTTTPAPSTTQPPPTTTTEPPPTTGPPSSPPPPTDTIGGGPSTPPPTPGGGPPPTAGGRPPGGVLAVTGGDLPALLAAEVLLVGAALWCFAQPGRNASRRRLARVVTSGPKPWSYITFPGEPGAR
jgi:hypothetical protein